MEEERLDLSPKAQILNGLLVQAGTEQDAAAFRAFADQITDEQAAQLLALEGFTEPYKIPIWDNELGGPARDANRKHDTPPDRYFDGQTAPRNVIDDLAVILSGTSSFEEVLVRVEAAPRLNTINPLYWGKVGEILGKPSGGLPAIVAKRIRKFDFPVDKFNNNIWKNLEGKENGQIFIPIGLEKHGSGKEINGYYSINFYALGDNVSITRKLTPFDKRVYIAIAALFKAGNAIISLSMIHNAMGYTSTPNARDLERINDSVSKMAAAMLFIDNQEETEAGYKFPKWERYSSALLPMERLEGIINGKHVEAAIHLFREPPLMDFARGRKQLTTIERKLLETPVNKTDQNLLIEDYLIERISRMKKDTAATRRILYETLYTEAQLTTRKQRQRAGDKLGAILGHYMKCGYIRGYDLDAEGITIRP